MFFLLKFIILVQYLLSFLHSLTNKPDKLLIESKETLHCYLIFKNFSDVLLIQYIKMK